MEIKIRELKDDDIDAAVEIWNSVVDAGVAFPQTEPLNRRSGAEFFVEQSFTAVAFDAESEEVLGLYILHPNNIGRCSHICNASYAVKENMRGHHIGRSLVTHCMQKAKQLGFTILQFNAVVATNAPALSLYESLGFIRLGTIPKGFLLKSGEYADIIPHYIEL